MASFPKKPKLVESAIIQQKLVESRLRGIDDEISLDDDKILSFVQMRQMMRVMRRFKGYVFFHGGMDEEHTRYDDTNKVVSHLYYPEISTNIHKNLELVMHAENYNSTKNKREQYLLQLQGDANKLTEDSEVTSSSEK